MPTEAEFQLLQSRMRELEDRLENLYGRRNLRYADPTADPVRSPEIQEVLRRGNKYRSN